MRKGIWLLVTASLMLPVAACGGGDELKSGGSSSSGDKSKPSLTVGSANFPENVLLGEIYAGALTAKKFNVSKKLNIGARAAVFSGLERGDLTVVPEYTGSLLGYVSKGKGTGKDAADQVNQLKSSLPRQAHAARAVDGGGQGHGHLQQGDRRASSTSRASRTSSPPARRSSWAGHPSSRAVTASGSRGSSRPTASTFKEFKPLDVAGPLSVAALKANKVNCANLFSTQSAIPANGFITLEDPKHLAQTEAVVPLIAKTAATPEVSQVLNDVSSKLTTDNLVEMVKRVEVDKDDAATVADDFLSKNGLK